MRAVKPLPLTCSLALAGLLWLGLPGTAPAAPASAAQAGASAAEVTSVEGITEYRLPNGLRVVLRPTRPSRPPRST